MTKGPFPPAPARNEGEYARKLALAILSTLEQKGLLTRTDVDTILHAAHLAAQPTPPPPVKITLGAPAPGPVPAPLGTRWVKAEQPQPAQSASSLPRPQAQATETQAATPGPIVIPSPEETQPVKAASEPQEEQGREEKVPGKKGEAQPPVIDFTLD